MSKVISVRVNDDELEMLDQAAVMYNCGVSSLIKKLALEKLEDEYDLSVIQSYEEAKSKGKLKLRPAEELWEELEL